MKIANIGDLKNNLSEYLLEVEKGQEIVICKRNVPVARITGIKVNPNRTKLGCGIGTGEILGPIDEPLIPANNWQMLNQSVR